jgi:hypothetical protein
MAFQRRRHRIGFQPGKQRFIRPFEQEEQDLPPHAPPKELRTNWTAYKMLHRVSQFISRELFSRVGG